MSSFFKAASGSFGLQENHTRYSYKSLFIKQINIMSALYILIIASLFVATGFLGAFIWSVRKGHFDDDCTPAIRILLDETDSDQHH